VPPDPHVTTTSTVPALPAGVVAVIDVELATETEVAAVPPNATVHGEDQPVKFVPVMVTLVPVPAAPRAGETLDTVGAAE